MNDIFASMMGLRGTLSTNDAYEDVVKLSNALKNGEPRVIEKFDHAFTTVLNPLRNKSAIDFVNKLKSNFLDMINDAYARLLQDRFTAVTTKNLDGHEGEVWVSGKCVALTTDYWKKKIDHLHTENWKLAEK